MGKRVLAIVDVLPYIILLVDDGLQVVGEFLPGEGP
jgi:hypothetical protein